MGFIKVCPKCNTVNPANRTECSECHKDLTRERKMTEEKYYQLLAEKEAANAENSSASGKESEAEENGNDGSSAADGPARMAYICDNCGQPNDTRRSVCISCGESLAGLIPTPWPDDEADTGDTTCNTEGFYLRDASGDSFMFFSEGEYLVGKRENGAQLFADKDFVSGIHAKIIVENGAFYVEDCSTNGTYINGRRINKGDKVRLIPGQDLVGFGSSRTSDFLSEAAYFKVEIQ